MSKERSSFSGKLGFVLATAGSAVGLGNIWRFPYLAAKQGGGIFLLTYIVLLVFVGFFLCISEVAIGRKTGKSTLEAFGAISAKHAWIGYIPAIVPVIILPYYSVVGGWVIRYLAAYLFGQGPSLTDDAFFGDFIASPVSPIICFAIFFLATAFIVSHGVEKGVEKASRIMMPVLVVLCAFVAVYILTIPGAMEGVKYLFIPNFSQLTAKTVFSAMSQMFYSLSVAMGILITYGSYMKKDVALDSSVMQVAVFDTGIAVLSALMVIPGVFIFSHGDLSALNKGAGLMFVTLPKVFSVMKGGAFIAILFFLLVLFAALTSAISLMEAIINEIEDRLPVSRKRACLIVTIFSLVFGLLSSWGFGPLEGVRLLGFGIFDFLDFVANNVLMPVGAFLICLFVAWVAKPKMIIDEVCLSSRFKMQRVYAVVIRYIAPIAIGMVFISSILEGLGIITY